MDFWADQYHGIHISFQDEPMKVSPRIIPWDDKMPHERMWSPFTGGFIRNYMHVSNWVP